MGERRRSVTIKRYEPVPTDGFVNAETGEVMGNGERLVRQVDTGLVGLTATDYVIVEAKALKQLAGRVDDKVLGAAVKLSVLCGTPWNMLCHANSVPYDAKAIGEYLGIKTKSTLYKLLKDLRFYGILIRMRRTVKGSWKPVYVMNPYFARRRSRVASSVMDVVRDLRKPSGER